MRGRLLATLVALALLGAGCTTAGPRNSAGQVTRSAAADAFAVRVGDCTGPLSNGSVETLSLVPCDQAHAWEAYARTELTGSEYPGAGAIQDQGDEFCSAEFRRFVGVPSNRSTYRTMYLQPTRQTWEKAVDREIVCLVGLSSGGIKGSLRGVKK